MTEWYFADGQERQGPLTADEMRLRFQRAQISLTRFDAKFGGFHRVAHRAAHNARTLSLSRECGQQLPQGRPPAGTGFPV